MCQNRYFDYVTKVTPLNMTLSIAYFIILSGAIADVRIYVVNIIDDSVDVGISLCNITIAVVSDKIFLMKIEIGGIYDKKICKSYIRNGRRWKQKAYFYFVQR